MNRKMTLGSLFDGSGGFPLGAVLTGIEPLWASEIEPFPIRVTTKRLPMVKHLGDVRYINGTDIKPVDIITFGSPCTNLSVAGLRAGIHGEQSSLFFEAIRIIKEMRCSTDGRYPRYAVFENVPGVFNSGHGDDFRQILEAFISIKNERLSVPLPENSRWLSAGEIVGDGFSLVWRTLDAQYFGVAQRRRRCYLVADFNGERANEILFESESLSGNPPQSSFPWQAAAGGIETCVGASSTLVLNDQGGDRMDITAGVTATLRAESHHPPCVLSIENHPSDGRFQVIEDGTVQTLTSRMGTGGMSVPCVMKMYGICSDHSNAMLSDNPNSGIYEAETSRTLDENGGNPSCNQGGMAVVAYSIQGSMIGRSDKNGPNGDGINEEISFTLDATDCHAVYAMTTGSFTQVDEEIAPTLASRDYKDAPVISDSPGSVRRLTPGECAMLQGFPPWWCANLETPDPSKDEIDWWSEVFETHRKAVGKSSRPKSRKQIVKWLKNPHSDSKEYSMWGNGVALPCVVFILSGIARHY